MQVVMDFYYSKLTLVKCLEIYHIESCSSNLGGYHDTYCTTGYVRQVQLYIPNRHKKAEKGGLRARIHYPALKFQQLAILTCAHGCVFSMHH